MAEFICGIVSCILAIASLVISILQFSEKGFIFNNAYIWASHEEREAMNKKPYYRQSAVAFAIVAAILFIMAIECLLETLWLWLVVGILSVVLLIYALVPIEKQ